MKLSRVIKRIAKWGGVAILVVILVGTLALVVGYFRSDNDCARLADIHGDRMKAIIYCDYGLPDVLKLADIEKPKPKDHEILIKIRAASINPLDWHFVRGTPYVMRLDAGLRKPKFMQLGVDFAGTVEAVGTGVAEFKPGDDIFGVKRGALAEYVCAPDDRAMVHKPAGITFAQAASMPVAAVTALQALRDKGKVRPGQSVLINGASGGVGTFAVQIAKSMGAEVTGVCSTRNLEMVKGLGADHVIDYTREDFAKGAARYDVILDNVGTRGLLEFKRVLAPDGVYVLVGGGGPDAGNWIGPLAGPIKTLLFSPFVHQKFVMHLAEVTRQDLTALVELVQAGKVTPVIDRTYPLNEAPAAIRYLEEGHARGKVVITPD